MLLIFLYLAHLQDEVLLCASAEPRLTVDGEALVRLVHRRAVLEALGLPWKRTKRAGDLKHAFHRDVLQCSFVLFPLAKLPIMLPGSNFF